jgi:hypothetical protein
MTVSSVIGRSDGFCCKRGHFAILPTFRPHSDFFPARAVPTAQPAWRFRRYRSCPLVAVGPTALNGPFQRRRRRFWDAGGDSQARALLPPVTALCLYLEPAKTRVETPARASQACCYGGRRSIPDPRPPVLRRYTGIRSTRSFVVRITLATERRRRLNSRRRCRFPLNERPNQSAWAARQRPCRSLPPSSTAPPRRHNVRCPESDTPRCCGGLETRAYRPAGRSSRSHR